MSKKIAVYGSFEAKVPVKQRYWKWIYHRKGSEVGQKWYKKRVWKKPKGRFKKETLKGRYEFHGKGKDLYKAIVVAHRLVPKGFVDISARKFLEKPYEYGFEGAWIEKEVES